MWFFDKLEVLINWVTKEKLYAQISDKQKKHHSNLHILQRLEKQKSILNLTYESKNTYNQVLLKVQENLSIIDTLAKNIQIFNQTKLSDYQRERWNDIINYHEMTLLIVQSLKTINSTLESIISNPNKWKQYTQLRLEVARERKKKASQKDRVVLSTRRQIYVEEKEIVDRFPQQKKGQRTTGSFGFSWAKEGETKPIVDFHYQNKRKPVRSRDVVIASRKWKTPKHFETISIDDLQAAIHSKIKITDQANTQLSWKYNKLIADLTDSLLTHFSHSQLNKQLQRRWHGWFVRDKNLENKYKISFTFSNNNHGGIIIEKQVKPIHIIKAKKRKAPVRKVSFNLRESIKTNRDISSLLRVINNNRHRRSHNRVQKYRILERLLTWKNPTLIKNYSHLKILRKNWTLKSFSWNTSTYRFRTIWEKSNYANWTTTDPNLLVWTPRTVRTMKRISSVFHRKTKAKLVWNSATRDYNYNKKVAKKHGSKVFDWSHIYWRWLDIPDISLNRNQRKILISLLNSEEKKWNLIYIIERTHIHISITNPKVRLYKKKHSQIIAKKKNPIYIPKTKSEEIDNNWFSRKVNLVLWDLIDSKIWGRLIKVWGRQIRTDKFLSANRYRIIKNFQQFTKYIMCLETRCWLNISSDTNDGWEWYYQFETNNDITTSWKRIYWYEILVNDKYYKIWEASWNTLKKQKTPKYKWFNIDNFHKRPEKTSFETAIQLAKNYYGEWNIPYWLWNIPTDFYWKTKFNPKKLNYDQQTILYIIDSFTRKPKESLPYLTNILVGGSKEDAHKFYANIWNTNIGKFKILDNMKKQEHKLNWLEKITK